jgi:phosphohistidine phosphatase
MQLLLLRHADAVASAATDDLRPLSDKGRQQAQRVARFCKENDLRPELILSSPFLRTEETAQIVARELGSELVLSAFLAAGMMPFAAMEELRAVLRFDCVMLVGHEPDLGSLAGALLGAGNPGAIHFRKATLAALEVESLICGGANLEFLVPAKLI